MSSLSSTTSPKTMTTTLRNQLHDDIKGRLTMEFKAQVINKCMDLDPNDRPFNPYNPGDDPHFHKVVADLVQRTFDHMAEMTDELFEDL